MALASEVVLALLVAEFACLGFGFVVALVVFVVHLDLVVAYVYS